MSYFQQQNPWMSFAEAGRGVGSALGQYLTELPRLRAEVAIQAQREPQRLALEAKRIEGQGIENALHQAELENIPVKRAAAEAGTARERAQTAHYEELLRSQQAQTERDAAYREKVSAGTGSPYDDLLNTEAPMQFQQPRQFSPIEAIQIGAQGGASREALSPYEFLLQHAGDEQARQAHMRQYDAQSALDAARQYALENPSTHPAPEHLSQNFGNFQRLLSTTAPMGMPPNPGDPMFDQYSMATNGISQLGGQILGRGQNAPPNAKVVIQNGQRFQIIPGQPPVHLGPAQ